MRISDWSSDVCSSDLRHFIEVAVQRPCFIELLRALLDDFPGLVQLLKLPGEGRWVMNNATELRMCRSEEHTSELQSLMRISYAVFCLKKKNRYIYSNHNESDLKNTSKTKTIYPTIY